MSFATKLLAWYDQHGRQDLPWRQFITPYRVWLSEIMLQQTQVKTVIDYFNRFIKAFPNIQDLANAHEDEVLHLWSGLGYYSRARNLHKTAKIICENYKGKFPENLQELEKLPGIGRSTAAAIYSISFDKPAAILDGNVKRVLSRYFAISGWPGNPDNLKELWEKAESVLPKQRGNDYTQAIMDLGAMICTRKNPHCSSCPVTKKCLAYQNNLTSQIPASKPKTYKPEKAVYALIIQNQQDHILLEKRPPVGIWGGLWCLPVCELNKNPQLYCQKNYGLTVKRVNKLEPFRHTFSHFHLDIHPIVLSVEKNIIAFQESQRYVWQDLQKPRNLGLAAPIKKLILNLAT